jgi:hypothetical protein
MAKPPRARTYHCYSIFIGQNPSVLRTVGDPLAQAYNAGFYPSLPSLQHQLYDRSCMAYIYVRVVLPLLTQLFSFLWHGNPSRLVLLCGIYLFSNGVSTVELS